MKNIINQIDKLLDDDLSRLLDRNKNVRASDVRASRDHFIKYLVSVVTHPIGLRASVIPFNSNQEHMLAYIMDIFNMSDRRMKKLFGDTIVAAVKSLENENNKNDGESSASLKKRHSWRPELRFRLNAPKFFYDQQAYLSNLSVRVYLFKEKNRDEQVTEADQDKNKAGILHKVFKRLKLDTSALIRPVNEMRRLVRFELLDAEDRGGQSDQLKLTDYIMVQVADNAEQIPDDIHLNIRRYYCDPNTVHILRLEFWLDRENKKRNLLKGYRNFLRRLVYNRCRPGCCFSQKKSIYMNEKQEFYGYVNIKLSEVPAYPIKQNYPIVSMNGRKVNNCEVDFEFRNRRILEETNNQRELTRDDDLHQSKVASDWFIINHLRLYANCLISQCLSLHSSQENETWIGMTGDVSQTVTMDNLLYIPAYTLINQHRLQSNINLLEDQCIRRISILLLLIKLEERDNSSQTNQAKALLVSVIQNEYMVAHSSVDDKTMQEIDPFKDSTRDLLTRLEFSILREFAYRVLNKRIQIWLQPTKEICPKLETYRYVTLHGLRMFKAALSNFVNSFDGKLLVDFQDDVAMLRSFVEQLLCNSIIKHLSQSIKDLLPIDGQSKKEDDEPPGRRTVVTFKDLYGRSESSVWLQMLKDINQINQDLKLFWMREGFDGLVNSQLNYVGKLSMFERLEKSSLKRLVGAKIDNYLR